MTKGFPGAVEVFVRRDAVFSGGRERGRGNSTLEAGVASDKQMQNGSSVKLVEGFVFPERDARNTLPL